MIYRENQRIGMLEIPPAKDTDAEDVVWGLQTADTLWKRGERIDALVWLRRAAQAAGDANDDDRALELARYAAELTEWMANNDGPEVAEAAASDEVGVTVEEEIEAEPDAEQIASIEVAEKERSARPASPWAEVAPPAPPRPPPPPPPVAARQQKPEPPPTAERAEQERRPGSVPPAEAVHAGMFDPWADQAAPMAPALPKPLPAPPVPVTTRTTDDEEEVVTSVRAEALLAQRAQAPIAAQPPPPPPPRASRPGFAAPSPLKPPPLPPRARPPVPKRSTPDASEAPRAASERPEAATAPPLPVENAPEVEAATATAPPPAESAPAAVEASAPEPEETVPALPERAANDENVAVPDIDAYVPPPEELKSVLPPKGADAPQGLVLDDVEAFADLPDDARTAFAAAATVHALEEGEEIGAFALAYIVSGKFDVAATVVDAPAVRLSAGAVLRARGTTEENVPMRLICAEGQGSVATWSDAAVEEAFRTIPWVEDDLRAAADKVQTLVGITIGPLGERLDVSIREEIVSRLEMRPLGPNEIVVQAGEPVPGLLLVGLGEIELVKGDAVTGVVGCGDFLFPTEVLGAGSAPATARAGKGGALVMFGDRRIAQELLVTCPPLLEVFAGM